MSLQEELALGLLGWIVLCWAAGLGLVILFVWGANRR